MQKQVLGAHQNRPVVLVFSGHDPSGGGGLHADIESIGQYGCHAVSVVTLLTVQDACQVFQLYTPPLDQFKQAAKVILKACRISAIKIGAIAEPEQVDFICGILARDLQVPVVLDPVLSPTRGPSFADAAVFEKIRTRLLPKVTLCTPNLQEAFYFSGESTIAAAAARIAELGCQNCLITSAITKDCERIHLLFDNGGQEIGRYTSVQLAGEYHGSGCTLAAAITARLASGLALEQAVGGGTDYVEKALSQADRCAGNIFIPNRIVQ